MSLSPSAKKVQDALNSYNIQLEVFELPDSTHSAAEAAEAIGCRRHSPRSFSPDFGGPPSDHFWRSYFYPLNQFLAHFMENMP